MKKIPALPKSNLAILSKLIVNVAAMRASDLLTAFGGCFEFPPFGNFADRKPFSGRFAKPARSFPIESRGLGLNCFGNPSVAA
jgi:hypothetical protein